MLDAYIEPCSGDNPLVKPEPRTKGVCVLCLDRMALTGDVLEPERSAEGGDERRPLVVLDEVKGKVFRD